MIVEVGSLGKSGLMRLAGGGGETEEKGHGRYAF